MNAPPPCPICGSSLDYVWQQVRELRQYTFDLHTGEYVDRSSPVDFDDSAATERILCPVCFAELPLDAVDRITDHYEAFMEVP